MHIPYTIFNFSMISDKYVLTGWHYYLVYYFLCSTITLQYPGAPPPPGTPLPKSNTNIASVEHVDKGFLAWGQKLTQRYLG